ncbi:hypothetical protein P8452_35582 [Trifolium repens]|nr:hypothetical protein P8452_35582 [Trifolium repens]
MRITLVSFLVCCYYYYCIYITHASPNFLCLEDQQSLLLQFKNNLTFDPINSTKLKFWNNSTYCCDWSGVTCDNEGHVIALFLNEEHISGGFSNSSSLFSLQHLQVLYFSDNNFNSSIPSGFGKLDKLTILDLSSCHFYGTLSDSMSNLAHLAYLDLSDNDFSGAIPSSLFTLPSLKEIRLEYNQFSKLDEFFNVSSSILEILHLHGNYLAGPFPISIFQLKSLSQLKLSFNKFNGSIHLGNYGLYGPPLTEIPNGKRPDELHPQPSCRRLASSIDWNFLSVELGFVSGLGIIIVSIMLWKKWRVRYWKVVDKILCWMFSRMYLEYATDRGQTYTVLRW